MSELKFYTCKVPRKGKGKGVSIIETLAIPIIDKETGIATDFDNSPIKDKQLSELVEFIESSGKFTNRALVESCFNGINEYLSTKSIRESIATTELAEWIMSQDLAETELEAKEVANLWAQTQEFQKKCGVLVLGPEDFAVSRREYVQKRKDAGVWKIVLLPKKELEAIPLETMLNTPPAVVPTT
jgi:hypothetical protein